MISKFFRSRGRSFRHAFNGIASFYKAETNARIHLFFTTAAVFCGFLFKISAIEWCCVLIVIGMVMTAEAINTAIERNVDLATLERHPLAKDAKDIAAAAVLFSAFISVIVGLLIFLPKLFAFFVR